MNKPEGRRRRRNPSEAEDRLPEIPSLSETGGPRRTVSSRTSPAPPAGTGMDAAEGSVEPFDMAEMIELLRKDAARNPALADYWRDGSDEDEDPLIYLTAPFSHPEPEVSRHRLEEVDRYAVHLLRQGKSVFSPLSRGARLDSPDIPNYVWYELGLRIMEGCDQLRLLALDGWEDSEGVRLELERARQLDIPVFVVNPGSYEALPRETTCV